MSWSFRGSRPNESSGAEQTYARLSALDHLVSQLQRKQILHICPLILVKETPNLSTERLLIWNPEPHRRKRKGSKNNCLFHSLLILPLSWHHNFPPRMRLVNHRRRECKLKYPRCSCSPIKPVVCILKKKKWSERLWASGEPSWN